MRNFITQAELIKKITNKSDFIILDARAELTDASAGFNDYQKSHLKNAQFVSMKDTMTGTKSQHGGRHPLPDMKVFIAAMKKTGMTDSSTVVIYDDGGLAMAGRLWWLLKYAGKDNVYLLEGGMEKWLKNKQEVTNHVEKPMIVDSLSLNINHSLLADIDEVKKAIPLSDTAIIDSRSYERYSGQIEPLDTKPGHFPSAMNYPWTDLVDDGKIINQEEAKEKFKSLNDYKDIIVHCGSGITGTVNMLFMEEIGLKPKLYLGGYSDWVSYEELDVIKE